MNTTFIAVEGPIGVGKSSLAKVLSDHFQFHLLNEIVNENPFLSNFYKNIEEWSFQTEMFFLCNRFKQLEDIRNHYLKRNLPVVSDYHMFKNLIFAKRTLSESHFQKYEQIFHILNKDLPTPNLIIYIHADLQTLFTRIAKRDRDFERNISPIYLENLCIDYDQYITHYQKQHPEIPILKIDGNKIDFIENKQHLKDIINDIESLLIRS
ncbi:deoxynucleoside kinase [Bacillus kwashiorkori]|uniref:deoxynucleoside kinase n=1 Tax=Bacillus kwashiorkori TaxID=1522318 RepID=UPI00078148D7|nr:deoxynucleoside kinase [Bacillus kwashiorkori]